MGFEPTTHGTTIRYSNQLSYTHHQFRFNGNRRQKYYIFPKRKPFFRKIFIFSFFRPEIEAKTLPLTAQRKDE